MSANKIYSVIQASPGRVNIIDAQTGAVMSTFSYTGTLISSPIVVGDKCTYVLELPSKEKRGYVRKLPSGFVINQFSA